MDDEYAEGDPYAVEENIDGAFHKSRVLCTLDLVETVVAGKGADLRLLDIGCGQGHITARFKETWPALNVFAADYSVSAVTYASRHFEGIAFAAADAYQLPYISGSFDIVVCNNLWEHLPDPVSFAQKIRAVLKPDGHLIISTPSRYRLGNMIRVLSGRSVAFMSSHHVTEYTVGQTIEQLGFAGYRVVRIHGRAILPDTGIKSLTRISAMSLLGGLLRLVGSHHRLESTVFFLAGRSKAIPALDYSM